MEQIMEDQLKKIIIDKFNLREIDKNLLLSDLVSDSLSRIEMLFELEKIANKKLSEDDIFSIETVGDLIKKLK